MGVPLPANNTCDIYRSGSSPPSPPATAGAPCCLQCDFRAGQEAGDRQNDTLTWTHIMLIDGSVDIRDGYIGKSTFVEQDTVFVPDQTGTQFTVIFVEHVGSGSKRVYLDRRAPTWPTDNL
jgi:hypothetical protein